jgi:hypothetical protein
MCQVRQSIDDAFLSGYVWGNTIECESGQDRQETNDHNNASAHVLYGYQQQKCSLLMDIYVLNSIIRVGNNAKDERRLKVDVSDLSLSHVSCLSTADGIAKSWKE